MLWLESWSNMSVLAVGHVVFVEMVKHVIKNAFIVTDRCVMFTGKVKRVFIQIWYLVCVQVVAIIVTCFAVTSLIILVV